MAEEPPDPQESPDTLQVTLSDTSPDYKPGEVVWTHNAHYRIEQITHDSMHGRRMFLLRNDLVVKPVVQFEDNKISVRVTDTQPKNPRVL